MRSFFSNLVASPRFSFYVTGLLFIILFGIGSISFEGFFSPQVFLNLFIDNAPLIIVTVGVTFTILSGGGGIDLSVGAVVSLCCMTLAYLMRDTSLSPYVCMLIALFIGVVVGTINGFFITFFKLQPFIVTLGTMFLCRGLTAMISRDSVPIDNVEYGDLAFMSLEIGDCFLSLGAIIALIVVVIATIVLRYTSFGRSVYAVGGNEQSSRLMGLRVDAIRMKVYIISGFCSALGGITQSSAAFRLYSTWSWYGDGRDCLISYRRHSVDGRRRIYPRYRVRRYDSRYDFDHYFFPRHFVSLVDKDCGRCFALSLYRNAGYR